MTAIERCVQEVTPRRHPRPIWKTIAAFSAFVAASMLGAGTAAAHGAAQWIADGGYRSPNGTTCCGESDCHRLAGTAKATRVSNGYKIAVEINGSAYDLFVPQAAVFGSIDDGVWFCALPQDYLSGTARCLFLPGTV